MSVEWLQRRLDLGAVEPDGAVDAAVADEHDVVVVGEPARLRELHVRDAGAALEAEDRLGRVRASGRGCGSPAARSAATAGRRGSRARRASRSRRRSCRPRWRTSHVVEDQVAGLARPAGTETRPSSGAKRRYARPRRPAAMRARATIRAGVKAGCARGFHLVSFRSWIRCLDAKRRLGAAPRRKARFALVPRRRSRLLPR